MKFLKNDLDKRREMMLNGNIVKTILFLTLPNFMMAIVQVLVPFSDSLFLNNILGTDVGAAVSYIQPVLNMLVSLSQGLGVVAMSMVGQANGKGNTDEVKRIALQIIVYGLFLGIILVPICVIFSSYVTPNNEELKSYVIVYFSLSAMLIPFQFIASIFNSIKSAIGEPESTFYRMFVLLILKIIFNYIFLIIFNLGIQGSIYASLLSYFFTTVWMYYDLFIKKYKFTLSFRDYKFDLRLVKEVTRLAIPSMLSYVAINLGFFLINREVAKYGKDLLAALAIASQITNICYITPTCIATTVTTMVSTNMGIGRVDKSKEVYKKGLIIATLISTILLVVVLVSSNFIVSSIYKIDYKVEVLAVESLNIYTYSVIPYTVFMVCQAVYNSLGKNKHTLLMSFLRIWVFRYFFIILTESYLGYYSVFYGNLFSNFVAGVIFYILVKKSDWKSDIKYE